MPLLQVYVVAPLAEIVAALPEQTAGLLTVIVGGGFTVNTAVFVLLQPAVVPVTLYVILPGAVEVTIFPVVALNPVEGVHTYELAPEAVNVAEPPPQIVAEFTVMVGLGTTVTVAGTVVEHPLLVPVTE
jgi:hypothetical protein